MNIKSLYKRLKYPHKYSNEAYIKFLTGGGTVIGENTFFYNPEQSPIDETSLPFISIGDNCRITSGVKILAHDYSYAVLRITHHEMIRKTGKTEIGNNVFIGMNSIILMNSSIGDNVIVGAGSVVSGIIPSNCIIAGNPAKVIMTLDDYYKKLKSKHVTYAKEWFEMKRKQMGVIPSEEDMGWFVTLWDSNKRHDILDKLRIDGDNKSEVLKDCESIPPIFSSYDEFISKIGE